MRTATPRKKSARDGTRFASDMTDEEWGSVEPLLPSPRSTGRHRTTDMREVVNALLYVAETGCRWRMLPEEFPPSSTVRGYFYRWRDEGLLARINEQLVMPAPPSAEREASSSADRAASPSADPEASLSADREVSPSADREASPSADREVSASADREASLSAEREASSSAEREAAPSAGVIDSQSVKTTESGGPRGHDAGNKRNLVVYVVDKEGETFEGRIIVARNQRVSDFLNAENAFVPIELHDGTIHLLGRRAISRVAPREDDVGAPARGSYDLSGQAFKLTKRKSAVSVLTTDGEVFEGHFFVTGDQRLSELLNGESVFVPFEFLDGKIHLIQRSTISRVIPREDDGGAPTEGAYYVLGQSNKLTKRKSAVSVVTEDGQILEGNFFVSGDQRLSDLLNGRNAFVPFEIHGGTIHLLARSTISRVVPREDDSGASIHVYQAQAPFKQPKRKTAVSLVTKDGEIFEGHVFVSRDQRASDVLNDGSLFVPFEFLDGKLHLIHRSTISRVVPREEVGGASEGVYFAQESFSQPKRRSPILVVAKDDEVFEGHFFVGGTERISDMLNAESAFVPFELLDGTIHLLARSAIRRVVPREDDGGPSEGSYLTQAPFKHSMRRFPAAVITKDDEVFEGHFFVPGRQRLSQVLKVENAFIPFELLDGTIQLLNRSTINRVVPREDEDEDESSAEFVRDVFRGSAREQDLVMEGGGEAISVDVPVTLAEKNHMAADADRGDRTRPARGPSGLDDPIGWAWTQWDRTSGSEIVALAGGMVILLIIAIIASTMWLGDGGRGDKLPDYQNGVAALASADYETARGVFQPLAEHGVARAQVQFALMHENGHGVPQDYDEARNWYLKAAAEGDVQGQLALGRIYFEGLGVSQDLVRAYMWSSLAAEKGDSSATRYRNDARAVMTGPEIGEAERRVREWRERHQASE